jgi:hypothetical protein
MDRRGFLKFVGAAAVLAPATKYLGWAPMPARPLAPDIPLVPVGSIYPYIGDTVPDGWLPCDGRTISALRYPQLYKAIGDTFGAEGKTRFGVPNMAVQPLGQRPPAPVPMPEYQLPQYLIRVA